MSERNWVPLLVAMLCLGFILWAGARISGWGSGSGDRDVANLVIALKPDKDPDLMLEARSELADVLTGLLGIPVQVIVPLSGAVIQEGLANGSIDIAFVSATDAWQARRRGVADVLLAGEIDGATTYQSYWVVLQDSAHQTLEDLRGRPIAFSSRTSTSGMAIPVWDLYRRGFITVPQGPEGFFGSGNVQFGVGYVSAVQRVLDGMVDAAAVSDYVLDGDRHLSVEDRARLRLLSAQGPVPTHVLIIRSDFGLQATLRVKSALLRLNETHPVLRDHVFNGTLVEVKADQHLKIIQEAQELQERLMRRAR